MELSTQPRHNFEIFLIFFSLFRSLDFSHSSTFKATCIKICYTDIKSRLASGKSMFQSFQLLFAGLYVVKRFVF